MPAGKARPLKARATSCPLPGGAPGGRKFGASTSGEGGPEHMSTTSHCENRLNPPLGRRKSRVRWIWKFLETHSPLAIVPCVSWVRRNRPDSDGYQGSGGHPTAPCDRAHRRALRRPCFLGPETDKAARGAGRVKVEIEDGCDHLVHALSVAETAWPRSIPRRPRCPSGFALCLSLWRVLNGPCTPGSGS